MLTEKNFLKMKIRKKANIVEKILDFNKQQKGKGFCMVLAYVAKVFDCKSNKISTP